MQKSIITSVAEVFPGSDVPHQYCQYHFLKNVGDAILSEKHRQLGTLIRDKEVKKEIEKVQREVEIKKKIAIFLFTSLLLNVTTMPQYEHHLDYIMLNYSKGMLEEG